MASQDTDEEEGLVRNVSELAQRRCAGRRIGVAFVIGSFLGCAMVANNWSVKSPVAQLDRIVGLGEDYVDKGVGKCLSASDGEDPKFKWYGGGNDVKALCDKDEDCTGYSPSRYGGGLLWYGLLQGGGDPWGGCHCLVKAAADATAPPPTPPVTVPPPANPEIVLAETVEPPANAFPNAHMIASGYNIFYSDPLPKIDGSDNLDPGLRKPVFKVQYKGNSMTADRRHVRPDGYFATVDYGCSEVFSTKTVSDAYELSTATNMEASSTDTYGIDINLPPPEAKVSISVGDYKMQDPGVNAFLGATGTLSARAEQIKKDNIFQGHRIVTSSARCAVYSAGLSYGAPPETHPAFKEAVDGTKGKADWYKVFDEFGTHFLSQVQMGARFGSQFIFAKSHYDSFQSILAKAGVSAGPVVSAKMKLTVEAPGMPPLGVKFNPQVKMDVDLLAAEQVETLNQHASSQVMQGVGPAMPAGGTCKWMDAVEKNPVPLRFSKMQMCAHPGISQDKRHVCASAMQSYCKEHLEAKGASCGGGQKRECQMDSDCPTEHTCREFQCVKIPRCHVRLYEKGNWGGDSLDLDPVDSEEYPNGKPLSLKNSGWYDRISSFKLSKDCASVKLYDDDPGNFFEGYAQNPTYTTSQRGLPKDLNDDVWQILVKAKPVPGNPPFKGGAGKSPGDLQKPSPIEFNPGKDHLWVEPGHPGDGLHTMDDEMYFPNVGKAMYGYNHFHGAPFSTKYAGVDPGFVTRGVWKVSYKEGGQGKEAAWQRIPMSTKARYFVVFAAKHPHIKRIQEDANDPLGAGKRYLTKKLEILKQKQAKIDDGSMGWRQFMSFRDDRWQGLDTYIEPELPVPNVDDEYCKLIFDIREQYQGLLDSGGKKYGADISKHEEEQRQMYEEMYGGMHWRRLGQTAVGQKYCEGRGTKQWTQEDQDKVDAEREAEREQWGEWDDDYAMYGWRRLHGNHSRRLGAHDTSSYYSTAIKPNMREFKSLAHAKQALRSESKCIGQEKQTCPSGADYDIDLTGTVWDKNQADTYDYDPYGYMMPFDDPWVSFRERLLAEWPRFVVEVGGDDKVSPNGVFLVDGERQALGKIEGYESLIPENGTLSKMLKFVEEYVAEHPTDGKDMGDAERIDTAQPDGWDVVRSKGGAWCESDMKTHMVTSAHKYEKATSSAFGVPKTGAAYGGTGFNFGLSYEKSDFLSVKGDQSRKMAMASSECGSYYATIKDLENNPPETEPALEALVKIANGDEDYYLIFDQFGLHFPEEVVFGARYGTTQYITKSSFETYQQSQESLSLSFGISVAVPTKVPGVKLKASRDVKLGYSGTEEASESVNKYFNERRTFSVGKRLPAGGIEEWKKDMKGEPMPIRFSLVEMCKHPVFKKKPSACKQAWDSYCEKHLRRMHPDLHCGEAPASECMWDIDCPEAYTRCDAAMCVPRPRCTVTMFSESNFGGQQKTLEPLFWEEHRPFHVVDLNNHGWRGKMKSIKLSGGCGKVIKMANNALDDKGNYVFTNWDGNDEIKKSGVRHANWLAIYPKENFVGDAPEWV